MWWKTTSGRQGLHILKTHFWVWELFIDLAFLPSRASFSTTLLKNCGRDESLWTTTCLNTVVGCKQQACSLLIAFVSVEFCGHHKTVTKMSKIWPQSVMGHYWILNSGVWLPYPWSWLAASYHHVWPCCISRPDIISCLSQVVDIVKNNTMAILQRVWHSPDVNNLRLSRLFGRLFNRLQWSHGQGLWNCFSSMSRWDLCIRQTLFLKHLAVTFTFSSLFFSVLLSSMFCW